MSATDSLQFFENYGLVILPALAVAEQIGIPIPAVPALLAVGALAADGRISIPYVLAAMCVAALAIDFAWYELGRRRGAWLLARFRLVSAEPDACVRRAESIFARHGARGMLAAKFLPGLTTVMPPLAGVEFLHGSRQCLCKRGHFQAGPLRLQMKTPVTRTGVSRILGLAYCSSVTARRLRAQAASSEPTGSGRSLP